MTADALLPLLKSTFGFDAFRGKQAEVVARAMAGERTLAVMPTGAGKSLTYQLPAVALDGCVVVVSPLIANSTSSRKVKPMATSMAAMIASSQQRTSAFFRTASRKKKYLISSSASAAVSSEARKPPSSGFR